MASGNTWGQRRSRCPGFLAKGKKNPHVCVDNQMRCAGKSSPLEEGFIKVTRY